MSSKFAYGLWPPVTAIRQAETDLNPATIDDDAWSSLLSTPPYPTYAGNLACAGASAARALQRVFGTDEAAFTVLWRGSGGNPDVMSPYTGFWQFAEDQADSRVFGGIHVRFDNEASQLACPQVSC